MKELVSQTEMQDIVMHQARQRPELSALNGVAIIQTQSRPDANWDVASVQSGITLLPQVQEIAARLAQFKDVDWDADEEDLRPYTPAAILVAGVPMYRGTLSDVISKVIGGAVSGTYNIQIERLAKSPRTLLIDEVQRLCRQRAER